MRSPRDLPQRDRAQSAVDILALSHGSDSSMQEEEEKEPLEDWRLVMLSASMGGVALGYGLQVGGGTAVMRNMGISNGVTQAVWLFGPISGVRGFLSRPSPINQLIQLLPWTYVLQRFLWPAADPRLGRHHHWALDGPNQRPLHPPFGSPSAHPHRIRRLHRALFPSVLQLPRCGNRSGLRETQPASLRHGLCRDGCLPQRNPIPCEGFARGRCPGFANEGRQCFVWGHGWGGDDIGVPLRRHKRALEPIVTLPYAVIRLPCIVIKQEPCASRSSFRSSSPTARQAWITTSKPSTQSDPWSLLPPSPPPAWQFTKSPSPTRRLRRCLTKTLF